MDRFGKLLLPSALAFLLGMAGLAFFLASARPETNLCGTFCDPAYLQYPGSPYASPCLVVREGPVPSKWVGIRLCNEGPRGDG